MLLAIQVSVLDTVSTSSRFVNIHADADHKIAIGLVGYPNVGKSSTINALIGAKKVSVSSTPGKTKHFQTIHLSDQVILVDCPGLVFPNFATTKADLVCNGVLPIDQLREYTGPATLVAQRIPKPFLEAVYGIDIRTKPLEDGGSGTPTGEELLSAYAKARGFKTTGYGAPDESRAARYILKDYVNGKLLYCEPPPGGVNPKEFNKELYDLASVPEKRREEFADAMGVLSVADNDGTSVTDPDVLALPLGPHSRKIDKSFFGLKGRNAGHMSMPFNYKYSEQGKTASGKHLTGRKAKAVMALERGLDPKDPQLMTGKKHFKGGVKKRKGKQNAEGDDD
jgi:large subunit GTPase 1